jgi:hypothetical protein
MVLPLARLAEAPFLLAEADAELELAPEAAALVSLFLLATAVCWEALAALLVEACAPCLSAEAEVLLEAEPLVCDPAVVCAAAPPNIISAAKVTIENFFIFPSKLFFCWIRPNRKAGSSSRFPLIES